MSVAKPLLVRRALLMAAVEATYGTAAATTPANHALLVTNPRWAGDVQSIARDINRASLSPLPSMAGRKTATITFSTEIRGNGIHNALTAGTLPKLGTLFRACGFSANLLTSPQAAPVKELGVHPTKVTWANGGTLASITEPLVYVITVTTGGASGTARVSIDSPVPGESSTNVAVTTATALTLGTKGLTVTPTFTGSLVVGQKWVVYAKPRGLEMVPVSDGFESVTLRLNIDGLEHVLTGAMGTFTMSARAGEIGTINWTFTGRYNAPTDTPMPAGAVYEKAIPGMFELARLSVDGYAAIVENFSFDLRNDIQIRSDANSAEGYLGSRMVGRTPTMGIDPEATQVAEHDFWGRLSRSQVMPFTARFGTEIGNTVFLHAPSVQYSGLGNGDRNGIATYSADMTVSGVDGDDELSIVFV